MRIRILMNKRQRKKLLLFLLVMFIVLAIAASISNKENKPDSSEAFHPIKCIKTEENIYTLTASLTGDEDEDDLEMLLSVCEGMGLKITFFVDSDWLDDNNELVGKIAKNGVLGLYIKKNLNGRSRNHIMEYIASCNDDFFEESGKYPKFVRISGDPDSITSRVLNAYGQYCISSNTEFSGAKPVIISKGSIVDLGVIDDNTAYDLAQAVGDAISKGLTCIEMESFLYEIGSETDEFGTQYA